MSVLGDLGGPRLDVPSVDDPMQLSPDMDRHASADDDIDIDLDIDDGILRDSEIGEDDAMEEQLDDANDQQVEGDQQHAPANDDEMIDEGEMDQAHQDHHSLADEDLEDADDPLIGENSEGAHALLHEGLPVQEAIRLDEPEADLEDIVHSNGTEIQDHSDFVSGDRTDTGELSSSHNFNTGYPAGNITGAQSGHGHLVDTYKSTGPPEDEPSQSKAAPEQPKEASLSQMSTQHTESSEGDYKSDPPDAVLSAQVELKDSNQQQESAENAKEHNIPPVAHALHPVTVVYQGNEMSLFPPVDLDTEQSQTYFLASESYASESLSSLFGYCKSVLADSIRDEEELEIKIPDLGLNINESSAEYTTITLSHILDIFVQLNHNDGLESPGPLYIELCSNYKASHRLEYLMTAVADGKGLSNIEFLNESESLSGGDDYAQDTETAAEDEVGNANSATGAEPGQISRKNSEQPLSDRNSVLGNEERRSPDIPSSKSLDDVTADAAPSELADLPKAAVVTQSSQRVTTRLEQPSLVGSKGRNTRSHEKAAINDEDIIDYSDEEAAPDRSVGSSTVQGEKVENGGPPGIDDDLDNIIDYGAVQDHAPTPDSTDHLIDHPSQIQSSDLGTDDLADTSNVEHGEYSLDSPNLEEAGEFEEIVDYDEINTQNAQEEGSPGDGAGNRALEDYTSNVAADDTLVGNPGPTKSSTTKSPGAGIDDLPTADIASEEDLDYVSKDTTRPNLRKISKHGGYVNDPGSFLNKVNGHDSEASTHNSPQDTPQARKFGNQETLTDDADLITYDDDDEITIPEQVDLKPTSSPPSLKRSCESQDQVDSLNGTSHEAKRIRST